MNTTQRPDSERTPRLIALLDGRVVGAIYQGKRSQLRFLYEDAWRSAEDGYPLSLSMPLTAAEHGHTEVNAFLWGLLPDNERTLDHYARTFGVSARGPLALLAHIGADCAGAVQLVPPERLSEVRGHSPEVRVDWIDEEEIARELRSARETGLAGHDRRTVGQFSLAGAQPKIALFRSGEKWGRPLGRTPTTHILKPPSREFAGYAENEHLCLELAAELGLGSAHSTVHAFSGEIAIVVERFDRLPVAKGVRRVHQEDTCQALAVMPWNKYESDGGPGIAAIIGLIQESSLEPEIDVGRFVDLLALNWVIAATDAHAKNYAFLHVPGGGIRLAPFYDIASYLPYAGPRLDAVKLAMRIGKEYLVRRIARSDWRTLATSARLSPPYVIARVEALLPRIPDAVRSAVSRATARGLAPEFIEMLAERMVDRSRECAERLRAGKSVG